MNTENQMTDLMEALKAKWPDEKSYRISLSYSTEGLEWFIIIRDDLGDDISGWGPTAQDALAKLSIRAKDLAPLAERKAKAVAALEAEIEKLQRAVTKVGAV